MDLIILIIVFFLLTLVVFLLVLGYVERKDLYNRIHAESFQEFSAHQIEKQKIKIPKEKERETIRI